MNDDYMFEDEVDEEAAAELERKRTESNEGNNNYNNNSNPNGSNPNYNNPNYNNPNDNYGPRAGKPENYKQGGTGKATASLILGIFSLVFFCTCINIITGIIAIVLGVVYLCKYDLSVGKTRAIVGIATGALSIIMLSLSFNIMTSNDDLMYLMDDDFLKQYYNFDGSEDMDPYKDLFDEYHQLQEENDLNIDNTL